MAVFSVSLPVRYLFSIALYVCLVSSTEAVVVEMQQSKSLSGMSTSEHFPTQPATSGSRTLNTHTLTSHLSHSTRTLQHLSEATEVNGRSYAQLYDAVGSYCEEWAVRFNTITDAEQRLQRLDALKRGAERGESGETYNNINRYYHDVADDVARRHNMLHLGQVRLPLIGRLSVGIRRYSIIQ
ncbi:hypothetical protein SARC_05287 [Sphaeroforma arctica JP610]|uniref:Uncharacterized protein n=1 Tax=Sphaeroforma arctica JP610 TaxID=667725 RepID=A0A0L0FZZ6_9EUKA|nr:hypothetical protein SARC_05287 [Sphaeroforma arctica JP610]KNC82437.1 hypothetical protein SARC_05287 [Sphaeroforma arctica JP610]|eukprot:XP_014156339.1 hypothetical protein SARC_05287 [Sphaeroforma arctica JP610]